ncbi:7-cyano-7-deazaguanine synthase [hydrothermal vent metagenome]|uniref:7-cyano-7-deazaguanine synthase n=1 Tax=hydrothermal vent metagenome TaxID=652676 RepID=A0A3B1CPT3_9ZZZZ
MKTAVALLSGGLDSATALGLALDGGFAVYTLSVDYGQRHRVELERALVVSKSLGAVSHKVVSVDLSSFGGSALTGSTPVPKGKKDDPIASGIPQTYVPARNTVFLSLALAYAETLDTGDIFIGVNAVDYSGYPDCRPEYVAAFEKMANLATKAAVEERYKIKIHTPLISMTKGEIIKSGVELGVDYSLTLSCYDPDSSGKPCEACDSCRIRAQGFKTAGLSDPALST